MNRLKVLLWFLLAVKSICCQIIFPGDTSFIDESNIRGTTIDNHNAAACVTHKNQPGFCKPLPQCFFVYTQLADLLQQQPCRLPGGVTDRSLLGVCCPVADGTVEKNSGVSSAGTLFFRPPEVPIPNLRPQDFQNAAQVALVIFNERNSLEQQLLLQHVVVQPNTPVRFHLNLFPTTPQTLQIGSNAIKNLETSIQLVNQNKLTVDQGRFTLSNFQTSQATQLTDTCQPQVKCTSPTSIYRTIDGSCNNLQNPDWGQVNTALQRIIPPKYGDGVNSPRMAEGDVPLPSARLVSSSLTETSHQSSQSDVWTLMLMQWGQFLDHDLTHSPLIRGTNGSGVACCRNGKIIEESLRHPDCFPIQIAIDDAFYGQFGQECMEFVRSLPAVRPRCTFGPREQMNQVTAYIDGSTVYASTTEASNQLREFRGGRLSMQTSLQKHSLLPVQAHVCANVLQQRFCFRAGDGRVNEQPQLAVMHTIWVREHNRIANILAELNPSWDDERLFQESRRIVGAEIQQITYNEFLPILLGDNYMTTFQLKPLEAGSGQTTKLYDPNINPSITNEFSAAAFRMGHSLIQGIIEGFTSFGAQTHSLLLHQHQFKPFELYEPKSVDALIRGLLMQPAQKMDRAFTDEIKNRLFQGPNEKGFDLIALNIQRGRDHGLPPYNDYRELCGRPRAQRWEDYLDLLEPQVVEGMRQIFGHVDDVDLYIGGISEKPTDGAILGPTFLCLIGDQMSRSRRGDRFFFEETSAGFTPQQLATLRTVSLARILCDNGDDIMSIQPKSFLRSDINNKRAPCQGAPDIPRLDLQLWRQQ